jgi:hypothetical protein
MAVIQISKIQLRRGQTADQGMPQLASGEMGWSVDEQRLFIGNGSVAEGSPAVGNTQILTEEAADLRSRIRSSIRPIDELVFQARSYAFSISSQKYIVKQHNSKCGIFSNRFGSLIPTQQHNRKCRGHANATKINNII